MLTASFVKPISMAQSRLLRPLQTVWQHCSNRLAVEPFAAAAPQMNAWMSTWRPAGAQSNHGSSWFATTCSHSRAEQQVQPADGSSVDRTSPTLCRVTAGAATSTSSQASWQAPRHIPLPGQPAFHGQRLHQQHQQRAYRCCPGLDGAPPDIISIEFDPEEVDRWVHWRVHSSSTSNGLKADWPPGPLNQIHTMHLGGGSPPPLCSCI